MAYRLEAKVVILKCPISMADYSKFRGIGRNLEESDRRIDHNLEKLARGPLSIRKISENDKIATSSRLV